VTTVQLPHEPVLWYHFMDGQYSDAFSCILPYQHKHYLFKM